jgi:hypothetical protein
MTVTPLSVYGINTASSTLSTANKLVNQANGTIRIQTATTIPNDNTANWIELNSQGGTTTSNAVAPAPSGKGWLYDSTVLESVNLNTGAYTASLNLQTSLSYIGVNILMRWYKRSSGGVYTLIGTVTYPSTNIFGQSPLNFIAKSTAFSAVAFSTGDKLYFDAFVQPTGTFRWTGGQMLVTMGNTAGGFAYATELDTPGYTVNNTVTKKTAIRFLLRSLKTKTTVNRFFLRTQITKPLPIRFLERVQSAKSLGTRLILRLPTTKFFSIRFRYVLSGVRNLNIRFLERTGKSLTTPFRYLSRSATKIVKNRFLMQVVKTNKLSWRTRLASKIGKACQFRMRYAYNSGPVFLTGGFGCYGNGASTAVYDQFRATTYPDRSLSLAPVNPTLGSTWFSYNADVPLNTSVKMELSFDGLTWYDMTYLNGAQFPTLFQQPTPTIDGFGVYSLGNYTSTCASGGATAVWSEDINNSQLLVAGGTKAILYNNNSALQRADIDIIGDFSNSDGGGFVWRFVDVNNFYYCIFADSNSSALATGLYIYRCVAGVHTLIQAVPISYVVGTTTNDYTVQFTRGAYYRFRLTMRGTLITISIDGNQITQVNDVVISSAGYAGLFNYSGNALRTNSSITTLTIQFDGSNYYIISSNSTSF